MLRALPFCLCLLAVPAFAEGVSGEVALNAAHTSGNTDTANLGLGLKLDFATGQWEQELRSNVELGREDGRTSKQLIRITYGIEHDVGGKWYGFANTEYFQDEIGAFKYGLFTGGGVGYRLAMDAPFEWEVEAGPGYRRQKARNKLGDPSGVGSTIRNELAVRVHSDVDWDINDRVSAYNYSEAIHSSADTYLWNEAGVTAELFGGLGVRTSFRVDHHTDVPVGRERTDTLARFGIVYDLGRSDT